MPDNDPDVIEFHTNSFMFMLPSGNNTEGLVLLDLITSDGKTYRTMLFPDGVANMMMNLRSAISLMPKPPPQLFGLADMNRIAGGPTKAKETITWFGQEYPTKIVQALGVLMIRANLLEHQLVHLLSALSRMPIAKANAVFFSSRNSEARLQMMRSLVPIAQIPDERKTRVDEIIGKVRSVFSRRNDLVHGTWIFKKDKFEVEMYSPASKEPVSKSIVTEKSILNLAADYSNVGLQVRGQANAIQWVP